MTTICFPPQRLLSSKRLSNGEALARISDYLSRAETDPSLHPDAVLTESGPITPAAGAGNLGLVLHNLKRVEAGLQGKYISPSTRLQNGHDADDNESLRSDAVSSNLSMLRREQSEPTNARDAETTRQGETAEQKQLEGMDWQNISEFEREQQDIVGGENNAADSSKTNQDNITVTAGSDVLPTPGGEGAKRKLDSEEKAARKKAKAERKEERAERKERKKHEQDGKEDK